MMDRNAVILLATFVIATVATYYCIALSSAVDTTPLINIAYTGFSIICGFGATAIVANVID
jgi:hypothetical protein